MPDAPSHIPDVPSDVPSDVRRVAELSDRLRRGRLSRRSFLTLASTASAAALLAGCGASSGGSGKKEIPFYTTESDPKSLAFYRMVVEQFEETHPGFTVKITVYQDGNQLQYLQTALQTGNDLGVFAPPAAHILDWADKGFLHDLSDLVRKIGEDDFVAGTRTRLDGKDFAVPFQSNASVLYYRKDLLDRAGIKPPRTYGDFLGAVTELNGRDGRVGISSGAGSTPGMTTQFLAPYVYQSGWDYFGEDGEVLFGRPEVLDAVERHVAIMRQGPESAYNTNYGDLIGTYISGRAAFATMAGRLGVNLAAQAPKIAEATGVLPVPAGPYRTGRLSFGGKNQYSVYAKTQHPEAATAFLEALTTGANALAFALTVPGHLLPPLKSVAKALRAELRTSEDPYLKKHGDWVATIMDLVPDSMSPDLSMGSVHNRTYAGRRSNPAPWAGPAWAAPPVDGAMVQKILVYGEAPEKAWREAVAKYQRIVSDWKFGHPQWRPNL